MQIRGFQPEDEPAVIALWRASDLTQAWNDPHEDIARKLAIGDDLFLVGWIGAELVGTVMAGYEGHRGWVNYLAVSARHRRNGLARALMQEAERRLELRGCPKVNLQIRTANAGAVAFYERIGYTTDDVISMGKRIEHDDGTGGRP